MQVIFNFMPIFISIFSTLYCCNEGILLCKLKIEQKLCIINVCKQIISYTN